MKTEEECELFRLIRLSSVTIFSESLPVSLSSPFQELRKKMRPCPVSVQLEEALVEKSPQAILEAAPQPFCLSPALLLPEMDDAP